VCKGRRLGGADSCQSWGCVTTVPCVRTVTLCCVARTDKCSKLLVCTSCCSWHHALLCIYLCPVGVLKQAAHSACSSVFDCVKHQHAAVQLCLFDGIDARHGWLIMYVCLYVPFTMFAIGRIILLVSKQGVAAPVLALLYVHVTCIMCCICQQLTCIMLYS